MTSVLPRQPAATPLGFRALTESAPPADAEVRGRSMPAELEQRYGGQLEVPLRPEGPTVVANFVSTLDGVVAF